MFCKNIVLLQAAPFLLMCVCVGELNAKSGCTADPVIARRVRLSFFHCFCWWFAAAVFFGFSTVPSECFACLSTFFAWAWADDGHGQPPN